MIKVLNSTSFRDLTGKWATAAMALLFCPALALADVTIIGGRPSLGLDGCPGKFQSVDAAARTMSRHFEAQLPRLQEQVKSALYNVNGAKFTSRFKSSLSIINKIQSDRGKDPLTDELAWSLVRDGVGIRLVLSDLTAENIDALVERLSLMIKDYGYILTRANNYHGVGIAPYLSEAQFSGLTRLANLQALNRFFYRRSPKINFPEAGVNVKGSGYTSVQFNFVGPNGRRFELQIRGKFVDLVAEAEHKFYDFKTGKVVSDASLALAFRSMQEDDSQLLESEYTQYLNSMYAYARALEQGHTYFALPELPRNLRFLPNSHLLDLAPAIHPELAVESQEAG